MLQCNKFIRYCFRTIAVLIISLQLVLPVVAGDEKVDLAYLFFEGIEADYLSEFEIVFTNLDLGMMGASVEKKLGKPLEEVKYGFKMQTHQKCESVDEEGTGEFLVSRFQVEEIIITLNGEPLKDIVDSAAEKMEEGLEDESYQKTKKGVYTKLNGESDTSELNELFTKIMLQMQLATSKLPDGLVAADEKWKESINFDEQLNAKIGNTDFDIDFHLDMETETTLIDFDYLGFETETGMTGNLKIKLSNPQNVGQAIDLGMTIDSGEWTNQVEFIGGSGKIFVELQGTINANIGILNQAMPLSADWAVVITNDKIK